MGQKADSQNASFIAACHANFIGAFEAVARLVPGGVVERIGGLTAVRTSMPGSSFNIVFGLSLPTSLREVREGIDRLFIRTRTQFKIITIQETLGSLKPLMEEMGLAVRTDVPGMVLDPIPDSCPEGPRGLEIRLSTEPEEIKRYLQTGAVGFGLSPDFFDAWVPGMVSGAVGPSSS